MVLSATVIIALIALLTATIGGLFVYIDSRRRNDDQGLLWTGITILGFIFGVLPGVVFLLAYLIVSRRF